MKAPRKHKDMLLSFKKASGGNLTTQQNLF